MENNPSHFSSTGDRKEQVAGQPTDRHPVENVSWLEAIRFCNALSKRDRVKAYYDIVGDKVDVPNLTSRGYRLPTEAEWEYACRAGTTTKFWFGDDPSELDKYAWYAWNSDSKTHPVGLKQANFGLYDMLGNVREWCWDRYDADYYRQSPVEDPQGPTDASLRVLRGGGWGSDPRYCRSADRIESAPGNRYFNAGFRLALGQSGR
jgi:formylglycine-generating enzyme required for sulfatase activity